MSRYWGLRPWKRHGLILAVAGFLYSLVGFSYATAPTTQGRRNSLSFLLEVAPQQVWGGAFMLVGILTMISSRWPPFAEMWGYVLLTSLSAMWGSVYVFGVLFFGSPSTNWTQALLWGVLAFLWWAISGLLNPDLTAVIENERG